MTDRKSAPDRAGADTLAEREDRLHRTARDETGLSDFGEDTYRVALRALLEAVASNHQLADADPGIDAMLVSVLRSRLYSEAGWREHPRVLERELRSPLIILGLPRTGTTILHNLLAQDPQFQVLEHWLIDQPTPRPPRDTWSTYAGYRIAAARQGAEDQAQRQKHHVEAGEPDECIRLMLQSFVSNMPGAMWPIPDYDEWFAGADEAPSYARYADNLRLIGDGDDRSWLLKNPNHVRRIDTVLDTWPDARIVQTHRDPIEQIPSICSLLAGRRRKLGPSFDPLAIGRHELDCWSRAVKDAQQVRLDRQVPVFDAYYAQLVRDPIEVVAACYAHFGIELKAETHDAMLRFLEENPQGKHGRHVYDSSEYGLGNDEIKDAFSEYIERHNLYPAGGRI